MRRTVTIALSTGAAVAVLGGGLALASERGSSDERSRPAATSTPTGRATMPSPTVSTVGRERAEQIALAQVPGGRVESIETEQEHGRTAWDVRIVANGVEHDIQIDRRTGSVLRDRTGPRTHARDDGADDNGHHEAGDDHHHRRGRGGGGHGGGGHH